MYSALKVNGDRLYKLARKGVEVERKSRDVTVFNFEYLDHATLPLPYFRLNITSSGGFYVRSLIADLSRR
jgi:tRNA pseudouridine55 synthase